MDDGGLRARRGTYGIDGGLNAIVGLVTMGAGELALAGVALTRARAGHLAAAGVELSGGLLLLQTVPSYLYSTRVGQPSVWAQLLADLHVRGDEHVLDMGCGRGPSCAPSRSGFRGVERWVWISGDRGIRPATASRPRDTISRPRG